MIWIILNLFKWLQMLSSYLNYFINVQFFVKWFEWSVWRKMEFTSVQQISLRMTEVLFKLKTIGNDNVNVVVVDKRTKREKKNLNFFNFLSLVYIHLFVCLVANILSKGNLLKIHLNFFLSLSISILTIAYVNFNFEMLIFCTLLLIYSYSDKFTILLAIKGSACIAKNASYCSTYSLKQSQLTNLFSFQLSLVYSRWFFLWFWATEKLQI